MPGNANLQADVLPGGVSSSAFTTTVPTGWVCLSGSTPLNGSATWQRVTTDFSILQDTTCQLVFLWCTDGSGGTNPAGAIDSIVSTNPVLPITESGISLL